MVVPGESGLGEPPGRCAGPPSPPLLPFICLYLFRFIYFASEIRASSHCFGCYFRFLTLSAFLLRFWSRGCDIVPLRMAWFRNDERDKECWELSQALGG